MNSKYLLMSLALALFSLLFFKIHKVMLKHRDTTTLSSRIVTRTEIIRRWIIFFILIFLSFGYLLKSFNLL